MNGFLNMLKPPGMSSHDVVARVRKICHTKAGHTGTLDPGAAGVLVVALGKATRLASFVSDSSKSYRCELKLGETTDTGDAEGQVIDGAPVPQLVEGDLLKLFAKFIGPMEQKPPMYSAVHYQGKRLYQLARQGLEVERPARTITIHALGLVDIKRDRLLFDVTCSKGTYVRVLCADLARSLGTAGHMSFLVRTSSGPFSIEATITLEDLPESPEDQLFPMDYPLAHLPAFMLTEAEGHKICHGNAVRCEASGQTLRRHDLVKLYCGGRFVALGKVAGENGQLLVQPSMVLL